MWQSPTPILLAWRSCLALCPTIIAAGNDLSRFHYPNLDLSTPLLPAYLLAETVRRRKRYADGALPLPSGTLVVTAYLPVLVFPTAGECELFARNLETDLGNPTLENVTDVPAFADFEVGLASDPMPGNRASADDATSPPPLFRTITLSVECGLSRG